MLKRLQLFLITVILLPCMPSTINFTCFSPLDHFSLFTLLLTTPDQHYFPCAQPKFPLNWSVHFLIYHIIVTFYTVWLMILKITLQKYIRSFTPVINILH